MFVSDLKNKESLPFPIYLPDTISACYRPDTEKKKKKGKKKKKIDDKREKRGKSGNVSK